MSKFLDGPGLEHLWKKMQAYVNEQYEWGNVRGGTGNNWWTYRKWKNGMIEVWGVATWAAMQGSAWTNGMYYTDQTVSFPDGIFESAPAEVYLTGGDSQWLPVGTWSNTADGFRMRAMKPNDSSQVMVMRVYAVKYPS